MNTIKSIFKLTNDNGKGIKKSILFGFLVNLANFLPTILVIMSVDQLVYKNNYPVWVSVLISIVAILLLFIFMCMEYEYTYNTTYKESANIRINIAKSLLKIPVAYLSKKDLTDLSQTIMNDVERVEHVLSHNIAKIVGFLLTLIVISVLMLINNLKMGLAVLIPICVVLVLFALSRGIQERSTKKYYDKLRENSDSFQENIDLYQEIKSYGMIDDIAKKLYKKVDERETLQLKTNIIQSIFVYSAIVIMNLLFFIVIVVGVYLLKRGEISPIYLVGYVMFSFKISDGMIGLSDNLAEIFFVKSRVDKICELNNQVYEGGKNVEIESFDIKLKNVCFGYNEKKVLENVSFTANQGEVTALVGKSGCGKTTLLRVISGLYRYDDGSISIGDRDIKHLSDDSIYRNISIVFQDVVLFNSSIMENVRIGRKDATDEEVIEACKMANCSEFIEKLKDGYNTVVGENGQNLSGGQRQRISIARAFLKNANIIILDEITASLDVENENKIQQSLNKLIKNKTVVVISHRLKSIENVDKIVVLDEGRVESIGKHSELIQTSKIYSELIDKSRLACEFKY